MRSHQQVNQSLKSLKLDLLRLIKLHFDIDIVNSTEWVCVIFASNKFCAKKM